MATAELSTRESWLAERNTGIGSSDSPIILGEGFAGSSEYKLWLQKSGKIPLDDEAEQTEAMECGTVLQPGICELIRRRSGYDIRPFEEHKTLVHPELSWLRASPDALIHGDPRGLGCCELKNVGHYLASDWKQDEPPLRVNIQLHHQMIVTGCTWGIAAALVGGNKIRWHEVNRNESFCKALIGRLSLFWQCVTEGIEPDVDGSEATRHALAALYPEDDGNSVQLVGESMDWDRDLVRLKAEIKEREAQLKELENKFRAEIREASHAILPNGVKYSHKLQHRAAYTVQQTSFRVLRRLK